MSVLIKGMNEMPEDGAVLVVRHDDNGKAYIKFACTYGYSMELVKLPEQHGRLIDENDVIELLSKGWKLSVYPNAANVHDDTCACNYNGIDEWLPEKCEVIDSCPDPVGVACWEQYLKHRAERRTDGQSNADGSD